MPPPLCLHHFASSHFHSATHATPSPQRHACKPCPPLPPNSEPEAFRAAAEWFEYAARLWQDLPRSTLSGYGVSYYDIEVAAGKWHPRHPAEASRRAQQLVSRAFYDRPEVLEREYFAWLLEMAIGPRAIARPDVEVLMDKHKLF